MATKIKPKDKPHYVNNAQFSQAVVDYVTDLNKARDAKIRDLPKVPDYIAMCFLKICEGLSHKSNFVRYTYREEMVMDAVENCLKAIENYNLEAATRTGKPNAFAYFTQISLSFTSSIRIRSWSTKALAYCSASLSPLGLSMNRSTLACSI